MKKIFSAIVDFLSARFNLSDDKADEQHIVEIIRRDVNFTGTNLWTLIFAILIASIGLNVNSTAVIIGAMLISPLMGPIMGIGLAIGINDFDLLKKGVKNLAVAAAFSVCASSIYFALTPLQEASTEILARTNPSVWDVFIAFFGGMAGIVAGTRREKSNVIPGVAIATALMPPLCTAGYGLANGKWSYFFEAAYLFFINSLFICLATFIVVKHLRFKKQSFETPEMAKRVSRYILLIVTLTVLPSIYLAYRIAQRSIFESNAKQFVQKEFHFPKTQVVKQNNLFDGSNQTVEVLLVGLPLPKPVIDSLTTHMPYYGLKKTKLVVHQGLDNVQKIDMSAIKASVLEEVLARGKAADTIEDPTRLDIDIPELKQELLALYPTLRQYTLSREVLVHTDSLKNDTLTLFTGKFSRRPSRAETERLQNWLTHRIETDSVLIVTQ